MKGPWFQLMCTFVEVEGGLSILVRNYGDEKFGILVVLICLLGRV